MFTNGCGSPASDRPQRWGALVSKRVVRAPMVVESDATVDETLPRVSKRAMMCTRCSFNVRVQRPTMPCCSGVCLARCTELRGTLTRGSAFYAIDFRQKTRDHVKGQ
jgi:hypothetical protein